MSEQGPGGEDRPRWEGFPGGVDPNEGYPSERGSSGPQPPQFPVPPSDETAPIPLLGGAATAEAEPARAGSRRSHRAGANEPPRGSLNRWIAFGCAAAVLVIGAIFLISSFVNNNSDVSGGGASVPAVLPPVSTSPSVASPSPTASASRSATKSASPSSTPSSSSSPSASATSTAAARKQPVTVLNSTAVNGLAKRVAADIEAKGWTVTKTANWTGVKPPASTIYYRPGAANKASAELFAKTFSVTSRVHAAVPGMTANLTLVLTKDAQ